MATTEGIGKVKSSVLAIGICASLVLGTLGLGASAEAAAPDEDAVLAGLCRNLKTLYENELIESKMAVGSFNRNSHLRTANKIKSQWEKAGCQEAYGSIA
jgi:hypothetical protein